MEPGENTYDGIKWNIEIKRDEEDIFGLIMTIMGQARN